VSQDAWQQFCESKGTRCTMWPSGKGRCTGARLLGSEFCDECCDAILSAYAAAVERGEIDGPEAVENVSPEFALQILEEFMIPFTIGGTR
jgi:hypothetical protein